MKENDDLISRQEAINALWKALYEYEDKTGKQFQESEDLDVEYEESVKVPHIPIEIINSILGEDE